MKRLICLLLALLLAAGCLPVKAEAAQSKLIALTYDDGPHPEYTEPLLDGLRERGVKVTFFVIGYKAEARSWMVEQAYDDGHEIANHSWDHPHLTELSFAEVQSQVRRNQAVLDTICGEGTDYLMRPPYGDVNESIYQAIGMPIIQWSVDSSDWATDEQYVYDFIMKTAKDGRIILCHDTVEFTARATLRAIDDPMAEGYEFVTVSELFRRRGMELEDCREYWYCYNQTVDLGPVQEPVVRYAREGDQIRVTMESPSGAPIYYTTDGSRITQESPVYEGSFLMDRHDQLRAVAAFRLNGGRSGEVGLNDGSPDNATPGLACSDPVIEIRDGLLYLSCADLAEPIFYTLDGTKPTEDSPCYTGPVALEPGTMIRAVAGGDDWDFSREVSRYYSTRENVFADVMPGMWYTDIMDEMVSKGLILGVGEGKYQPEESLTRAMMVELLYRHAGAEAPGHRTNRFSDISGDEWYAGSVEWAYATGVVEGYPDGTFRPNNPITRQEMAEVIAGFQESQGQPLPEGGDCRGQFHDGGQIAGWALKSFSSVVAAGLMKGDTAGYLTPLATATRAQFATILLRMVDRLPEKLPEEQENPIILPTVPPPEPEIM